MVLVKYNYSHSNKADFGNGGVTNSLPWCWGGIFSFISTAGNIYKFEQNYAANNECLGNNQSSAFFLKVCKYIYTQEFDNILNFCEVISFPKPNTVHGSYWLTASQNPSYKHQYFYLLISHKHLTD